MRPSGPGGLFAWDYREPEIIYCTACDHTYPDDAYPETASLQCPRREQTFTYYLNGLERAHLDDRSGKYAYRWMSRDPVHVSFSGLVRYFKADFMMTAIEPLGLLFCLEGDPHYARRAIQILDRLARCYRNWLYHDYWDAIADCDPRLIPCIPAAGCCRAQCRNRTRLGAGE